MLQKTSLILTSRPGGPCEPSGPRNPIAPCNKYHTPFSQPATAVNKFAFDFHSPPDSNRLQQQQNVTKTPEEPTVAMQILRQNALDTRTSLESLYYKFSLTEPQRQHYIALPFYSVVKVLSVKIPLPTKFVGQVEESRCSWSNPPSPPPSSVKLNLPKSEIHMNQIIAN